METGNIIAKFVGLALAIFLPMALFGMFWNGIDEFFRALMALAICLTLTTASIAFHQFAQSRSSSWQLGSVLGGSVGRCGLTLASAIGLSQTTFFNTSGFIAWIVLAYMFTLVLEVRAIYRPSQTAGVRQA